MWAYEGNVNDEKFVNNNSFFIFGAKLIFAT